MKGWQTKFDEPIPLPNRKPLVTLRDAALYITKLPKAEHDAKEWQAAMQALLLVANMTGQGCSARAVRSARSTGDKKPAQIMPHDESKNRPMASGFSDYR